MHMRNGRNGKGLGGCARVCVYACVCDIPHMLEHVFSICSPTEWVAVYYLLHYGLALVTETMINLV